MNMGRLFKSKKQPAVPEPLPVIKSDASLDDPSVRQRVMALVLLVILSTSFGFAGGYFGDQASQNGDMDQPVQRETIENESELISRIAKEVGESVVSVNVTSSGVSQSFFGNRIVQQRSAGTGVIIDTNGTIITNRHVIPAGATSVSVTLADGTELDNVEVIGRTNDNDTLDIAFLKTTDNKGKTLKAAKIGDSSSVQVGQKVIAIGNALGQFQNTVTTGIISGYGRTVEASDDVRTDTLQNLFQTDAAINEGNSGGPLVNYSGEVIGLNTAVAGDAENIGFAIPINDVKGLISSVLRKGKLLRPYLGVRYISLNDDAAFQYGLQTKRGAYIVPSESGEASIISGSPADKAGLREGDIITKVNNDSIDESNSLISVLGKHSVGDKVQLTVVREGGEQRVDVTLEAAPEQN